MSSWTPFLITLGAGFSIIWISLRDTICSTTSKRDFCWDQHLQHELCCGGTTQTLNNAVKVLSFVAIRSVAWVFWGRWGVFFFIGGRWYYFFAFVFVFVFLQQQASGKSRLQGHLFTFFDWQFSVLHRKQKYLVADDDIQEYGSAPLPLPWILWRWYFVLQHKKGFIPGSTPTAYSD